MAQQECAWGLFGAKPFVSHIFVLDSPLAHAPMTPLHASDLRLLPRIVGALAFVSVTARRVPPERLVRLVEREPRAERRGDVERVLRLTQAVLRRTHGDACCYPRSLVLFHVLSGWACPVVLHFGVRKIGGGVEGHAWLELSGSPLGEPRDPRSLYHSIQSYSPTHQEVFA